jgi:hypothetical protein
VTWFKVDDGFHSHPKAFRSGTAALGLWVRAGSWAANQLTDGFVPTEVVRMYGTAAMAKALVAAELWTKTDGGYQFHQWSEDGRQPTRQQVETERAAARERMKKRRNPPPTDHDDSPDVRANTADVQANTVGDHERSSVAVREPRPGPTRPGTYLLTLISRLAAGDARGGPPPASYLSRFGDRPAEDERGAWLGWLRKAKHLRAEAKAASAGREPLDCPRCHGGWLPDNDEDRPVPCPSCRPQPYLRALENEAS